MGKTEKYGSYVRKVGHYDIRQKIVMPKKTRDRTDPSGYKMGAGSVEITIYHGKKLIEKGFKSHMEAELKAKELQRIPI